MQLPERATSLESSKDELEGRRSSAAPHTNITEFLVPVSLAQLGVPCPMQRCCLPPRALPLLWGSSQLAKKSVEQRKVEEQAAKKSCPKTRPRSDNDGGTAKVLFLNTRTSLCLISNRFPPLLGIK